ncbi:MAG: DUF1993 family protein [Rhodoferax sp.]
MPVSSVPSFTTTTTATVGQPAVQALIKTLERARHLLARGEQHGAQLSWRLVPDMLSLRQQVVVLCDGVVGAVALLAAQEHPCTGRVFNRGEDLLPQDAVRDWAQALQEVCQAQQTALGWADAASACALERSCVVGREGHHRVFAAHDLVWSYALPNAWFHLSMVHALLRMQGVALGKADFEGAPTYRVSAQPPASVP